MINIKKVYSGNCTICLSNEGDPIGVSEIIQVHGASRTEFLEALNKGINNIFDRLETEFEETIEKLKRDSIITKALRGK